MKFRFFENRSRSRPRDFTLFSTENHPDDSLSQQRPDGVTDVIRPRNDDVSLSNRNHTHNIEQKQQPISTWQDAAETLKQQQLQQKQKQNQYYIPPPPPASYSVRSLTPTKLRQTDQVHILTGLRRCSSPAPNGSKNHLGKSDTSTMAARTPETVPTQFQLLVGPSSSFSSSSLNHTHIPLMEQRTEVTTWNHRMSNDSPRTPPVTVSGDKEERSGERNYPPRIHYHHHHRRGGGGGGNQKNHMEPFQKHSSITTIPSPSPPVTLPPVDISTSLEDIHVNYDDDVEEGENGNKDIYQPSNAQQSSSSPTFTTIKLQTLDPSIKQEDTDTTLISLQHQQEQQYGGQSLSSNTRPPTGIMYMDELSITSSTSTTLFKNGRLYTV